MIGVLLLLILVIYIVYRNKNKDKSYISKTKKMVGKPSDLLLSNTGKQGTTFLTKEGHVRKKYFTVKGYENNVKSLQRVIGAHIPLLISHNPNKLEVVMEYCGKELTSQICPSNLIEQIDCLNRTLQRFNICNLDGVNPKNYTVKNDCVYLIDWGKIDDGYKPIYGKRILEILENKSYDVE